MSMFKGFKRGNEAPIGKAEGPFRMSEEIILIIKPASEQK